MDEGATGIEQGAARGRAVRRRTFLMGMGGAAFLAACGGRAVQPVATLPAANAPAAPGEPTVPPPISVNEQASKTISFWYNWNTPPQARAAKETVAAFGKANPDIGVKLTTGAQVDTKLIPAITAGNPPDVCHIYYTAVLASKNALLPLDDYLARSDVIKEDNYTKAQWDAVTWQGKRYAVPALENGPRIGLIWNKGLFREAGFDPEKGPSTLNELLQYHEKLTKIDNNGNVKVIGYDPLDAMASSEAFFEMWANANGVEYYSRDGTKLNLNDPKLIQGVDWVADIYKKIGAEKIAGFRTSFGGWTGPDSSFAQGLQAIQVNGYWTPGELKAGAKPDQEFGYGWVPVASGKKFMLEGGHSIALPRGSKDPDTAFKLIEHMTTPEAGQTMFTATGFLNGNQQFFESGNFSSAPDVTWFTKADQEADVTAFAPATLPVLQEIQTRFTEGMDEVTRGKRTGKDMLDQLQSQMQKELDEQLKS